MDFKRECDVWACPLLLFDYTQWPKSVGYCTDDHCVSYQLYRSVAGKCDVCGVKMNVHPHCEGCDMMLGPGHIEEPREHREHILCFLCIKDWNVLEGMVDRKVTWTEYKMPRITFLNSAGYKTRFNVREASGALGRRKRDKPI